MRAGVDSFGVVAATVLGVADRLADLIGLNAGTGEAFSTGVAAGDGDLRAETSDCRGSGDITGVVAAAEDPLWDLAMGPGEGDLMETTVSGEAAASTICTARLVTLGRALPWGLLKLVSTLPLVVLSLERVKVKSIGSSFSSTSTSSLPLISLTSSMESHSSLAVLTWLRLRLLAMKL